MRILLVEDDQMIGTSLSLALRRDGMAVDWVHDGETALTALASDDHNLVLLDLGLPGTGGLEVLAATRGRQDKRPVLIITARDDVETRIQGLDLGADDFIVKPFDFKELAARIRAVARRQNGHAASTIIAGEITLDLATHEVSYRGIAEVLPAREFTLLEALCERPGTILSRAQLEDRLYGWGDEVESNAVDVLIHYVRRRFDKDIVRNVRGAGWMVIKSRQ
ncbi:MAG TPA: response regulator transcription factor [Arsenicitalea sp.]|jgi:DNA-binding response OmpR family regulator|nr:response regulator transcription factor [Arsenicitalea sp.]